MVSIGSIINGRKGCKLMPRVFVRLTDDQEKVVKKRAKEKGFIRSNGEVNASQYIRWLIENDK